MTTLTEVQHNQRREKSFAGKPRPVKSGIALARVKPVSHRSEVLLDDQISLVTQTQDELEKAMVCLNSARNDLELNKWRTEVSNLKAKCDEMILILTVVAKLKAELMYAKLELDKASKSGGDIREPRRRVVMLEDRMEGLLSKYRKMPRKMQPLAENADKKDQPQQDALIGEGSTAEAFSSVREKPPPESKSAVPEQREEHGGGDGKEVLKPERSILKQGAGSNRGAGDGSTTPSEKRGSERRLSFGQGTPTGSREILELRPTTGTSASEGVDSEDSDDRDDDGKEENEDSVEEGRYEDDKLDSNVFITEGSLSALDAPFQQLPAPQHQDDTAEDDDRDLAAEYWMSPHHRFEYSEQRDVITRENPLSYHNLGLAVQSSFIEPGTKISLPKRSQSQPATYLNSSPPAAEELPWRPRRRGSDLPDVHLEGLHRHADFKSSQKIALDKLSERIHKIWNKMEDATRKSIDCSNSQISELKGSIIRQVESRLSEDSASSFMKTDSLKTSRSSARGFAKGPAPPSDKASGDVVIEVPKRRKGLAEGPMMVYHPRPIPEPEMLPLTRTDPSKKFPRISSDWNDTRQESMDPTLRLVNQMNVAKETNLLVYKSKDKKRKSLTMSAAARQQQDTAKKRWKLASNPAVTVAAAVAHVNTRRKLSTLNLDKDSLKWKRILDILKRLTSERVEERRDAAMHLGSLDCSQKEVLSALVKAVQTDSDLRVRYEAAKSMVSLGYWSEHALEVIVKYMEEGNQDVRSDLVKTLINARHIQLADKKSPHTKKLISILRDICGSKDSGDLGFDCAVCLGCFGVSDASAKKKLKGSLTSKDTNVISRSLEILVRQMNAREPDVVKMVLHQMQFSKSWKHRVAAARLLVLLGTKHMKTDEDVQMVFNILERRLYDDPSREVRSEIATTLTALDLRELVADLVEKKLEDDDDDSRAHAVIAVGVLGMKADKIIRTLLEMLELDSCDYVRLQIIRTFASLGLTNIKIMRALKERVRSEGPLAREAAKSLQILNDQRSSQGPRSATRTPDRLRSSSK
ncbi:uncharacterized protein LOC110981826 isoform X2 [Acanthaster planci]|nr:uncharacterized protein LOC110981826 isoform X2 [Acanthaster planci]XP_022095469.1 uncharacterized protein LOC110981826 isoform X2 [Acanthaster planci]